MGRDEKTWSAQGRKALNGLKSSRIPFQQLRSLLYRAKGAGGRATGLAVEAASWITVAVASTDAVRLVEGMSASAFNTLSDVYTRAMDGAFATEGLQAGTDYVAPMFHRLLGGHTPTEAWAAVRDALPDDTLVDEFLGVIRALGSDMASVTGLPFFTLSPETLGSVQGFIADLGIPQEWLADVLQFNAVELLGSAVPMLATLLCWNGAEGEKFARLIGSTGISAIVSLNPVMGLIALVMLARSFTQSRGMMKDGEWQKRVAEGAAMSGIVFASSSLIGGPVWIGLIVGLLLAALLRRQGSNVSGGDVGQMIERVLGPALPPTNQLLQLGYANRTA